MIKTLNIVYDNWDLENNAPIPNLLNKYPNKQLSDPANLILHYQDDASFINKFEKKKCNLTDVIENPNENYYYIVNHGGNQIYELYVDEMNPEYIKYLNPFDDNIKKMLIENNNFFVIFLTEHEPDTERSFRYIDKYFKSNNIPTKKVFVVNNNSKLEYYKEKYNTDINVYTLNFIPHSSTKVLVKMGGCDFVENKKGKFFMCFNKSPKLHRYVLLCMLKRENLLDEINWSLVPTWYSNPKGDFYKKIFNEEQINDYKDEIEYFYNIDIKRSEYEENKNWFNAYKEINREGFPVWLHNPELMENYESSYVNIITESMFLDEDNNIHISEKSFKPFFYYQFPLILSGHHHIKKMKERFGFDFYDDIIDHSYDNEPNQMIRLKLFVDEIRRLNNRKNELVEYYKNNKVRFDANKNKVIDLLKIVDEDYKFWEGLI